MPTYESRCHSCGREFDYYEKPANCHNTPICCGKKSTKEMRTPPQRGIVENIHFKLHGQPCTSLKQRKEIMARNNLVEAPALDDWKHIKKKPKEFDAEVLSHTYDQLSKQRKTAK